jgi:hypothetical protein
MKKTQVILWILFGCALIITSIGSIETIKGFEVIYLPEKDLPEETLERGVDRIILYLPETEFTRGLAQIECPPHSPNLTLTLAGGVSLFILAWLIRRLR